MRRFILILTAAAALGLTCGIARAGGPGEVFAPNYGYQVNNYYGGWQGQPYRPRAESYYPGCSESYAAGVQRIMAAHSRYRYFAHPLSLQNAPPTQADYYGWGWGN
jgi:hypothetical protein